ncbi:MAG: carboxypeptidase, partial [Gammaproteobacteria bacterium]|nr:carboxypeptidase [Gammaproteobacteria bacterium]
MRAGSGYYLLLAMIITCLSGSACQVKATTKEELLPPLEKWRGESERLIVASDNPWQTPAEKSDLTNTPSYSETMFYLDRLVDSDPRLHKISLGKSPQGRDIWMVVASKTGHQKAEQLLKEGKPTLLVQAGIHSGEIDGKDAGLMLLRDIIHGGKDKLLHKVNLLFVPILSVDAHERRSPYNRVNQRGPTQMGWRSNARNLNLNRDYSKLDTKELQHLIHAINIWQPDLYFDVHVTDGEDYQYDITYGYNLSHADSPNISNWLDNYFRPEIDAALASKGHLGGPLVFG